MMYVVIESMCIQPPYGPPPSDTSEVSDDQAVRESLLCFILELNVFVSNLQVVSSKQVTDTTSAFDRPVRDRSLLLLLTLGDDCKAGKVDTLTHSEERPAAADDVVRRSSIIDLD